MAKRKRRVEENEQTSPNSNTRRNARQAKNTETEQLYQELLAYFGLVGATNQCQALEKAWKDPYNRHEIEEFIKAWLKKSKKRPQPSYLTFMEKLAFRSV